MAYGRDYAGAAEVLQLALSKLDRLQLRPGHKLAMKVSAYNNLLGLEILRERPDTARALLKSHPLMAAKAEILARGYFANGNEFDFALAKEYVRLTIGDLAKTGLGRPHGDAATLDEGSRGDRQRPGVRPGRDRASARQGGQEGRSAARPHQCSQEASGRSPGAVSQVRLRGPSARWADLVLADFAIEATLSQAAPDYDLIVQANVLLNRTTATSADDALTSQAVQPSDDGKRTAQSLQTIQYQQAAWEKAQILALTKRVLSADEGDREVLARERQRTLVAGIAFTQQLQRLRAALTDKSRIGAVDTVASLATVRQLLLADEALVLHASIFGRIGKICIRADSVQSSTQVMDSTARTDARLLMAALTAAHPASNEADSQFPAAQAVRLGKLLFGGLEDCLRRSPRIFVVSSPDTRGTGATGRTPCRDTSRVGQWIRPARGALAGPRPCLRQDQLDQCLRRPLKAVPTKKCDPGLSRRRRSCAGAGQSGSGGVAWQRELAAGTAGNRRRGPARGRAVRQVQGWLLQRQSATEEDFRLQPLSEFDVIHFATHGLIRKELPGLAEPSLVFTPHPGGDILNDGLLTASQIATLPLRARLVVLSACNSARYEPSVIDSGIQGLSTSFAIAGVPSMIAALWPVESTLARNLIIDTFRTARGGNTAIADALAIAVRRHLDGPTPRPLLHPRFWAALVVLGDGSIGLNTSAQAARRELGPFANVDTAERASIISAISWIRISFHQRVVTGREKASNR